jgi:hypothetical protein
MSTPSAIDPAAATLRSRWPVLASWMLCALLVPATLYGLSAADPYRGVSAQLAMGSRAQDVLTLALVPLLLAAGHRSRTGSLRAHLLWLGLLAYLAYSYAIYLVGWQQNRAFLPYAAVVTIATAALVDGLVRIDPARVAPRSPGSGAGVWAGSSSWSGSCSPRSGCSTCCPRRRAPPCRATSAPAGWRSRSTRSTWSSRCPRSSRPGLRWCTATRSGPCWAPWSW